MERLVQRETVCCVAFVLSFLLFFFFKIFLEYPVFAWCLLEVCSTVRLQPRTPPLSLMISHALGSVLGRTPGVILLQSVSN